MRAAARVLRVFAALAVILIPARTFAHSSEFILAKVTPQEGRVLLELTVDYGENPMVASEAEARAVLAKVLRVRVGGKTRELGSLASIHFERRTQIDPTAPIPKDPVEDAKPHQLLCAQWSWKCAVNKIAFEVPQDAGQSLILWTPAKSPAETPRWVFLLGGDVSPEIAIPRSQISPWLVACLSVAGLVGIAAPAIRMLRRKKPAASRSVATTTPLALECEKVGGAS